VINVIGDAGLVLGTFFIFRSSHSLDFVATLSCRLLMSSPTASGGITAGCLLLLVGAFRKVCSDSAAHMVAGRDGRTHAGVGADPCREMVTAAST